MAGVAQQVAHHGGSDESASTGQQQLHRVAFLSSEQRTSGRRVGLPGMIRIERSLAGIDASWTPQRSPLGEALDPAAALCRITAGSGKRNMTAGAKNRFAGGLHRNRMKHRARLVVAVIASSTPAARRAVLPLPLREGVGGRGADGAVTHPSPQPPPARGGGESPFAPSFLLAERSNLRQIALHGRDCRVGSLAAMTVDLWLIRLFTVHPIALPARSRLMMRAAATSARFQPSTHDCPACRMIAPGRGWGGSG